LPNLLVRNFRIEFILFLGIILFVIYRSFDLSMPYFWDEEGVFAPAALYMHDHGVSLLPNSLPPELSRGHPLLFFFLHGLNFKIFGTSLISAHSFALFISICLVIAVYITASKLFNKLIGVTSALILMSQEAFAVQSTMLLPEMLLCLFLVLSLYFLYQSRYLAFGIFSSLAVMTKETALIILFGYAIIFFIFYLNEKKSRSDFLKLILACLTPAVVFGIFLLIQKNQNGWYFFPYHIDLITFEQHDVKTKIKDSFVFLLIEQSRFLWLGIISVHLILYFVCKNVLKSLHAKRKILLLLAPVFLYQIFTVINPFMERYLMFVFVVLSILLSYSLWSVFEKRKTLYLMMVIVFLVFPFLNSDENQFRYDIDMSYKHIVSVQRSATEKLEELEVTSGHVYSQFPLVCGLSDKRLGYLNEYDSVAFGDLDQSVSYIAIMHPGAYGYPMPDESEMRLIEKFKSGFAESFIYKYIPENQ